ncbi:MAG: hypothetical protein AAGA56_15840, partial [Myxococcota bacterium]
MGANPQGPPKPPRPQAVGVADTLGAAALSDEVPAPPSFRHGSPDGLQRSSFVEAGYPNPAVTPITGSEGAWYGSEHPAPERDELVGTTLGSTYKVLRILGEGGMGRVYEAEHVRIKGKHFAIKALHPEFARRKDIVTRFY